MASLINKKFSADVRGVISVEGDKVIISVEDFGDIEFADFVADFLGKEDVKITISYGESVS